MQIIPFEPPPPYIFPPSPIILCFSAFIWGFTFAENAAKAKPDPIYHVITCVFQMLLYF